MAHELYFVPILAKALEQSKPATSVRNALKKITYLGSQRGYERGYLQFRRFMQEVAKQACVLRNEVDTADFVNALADLLDPGSRDYPGANVVGTSAAGSLRCNPYSRFLSALEAAVARETAPYLTVRRDRQVVGTIAMNNVFGTGRLEGLDPGRYSVELCTGRIVWEGDLSDSDLFMSSARQGRPLRLAAATGEQPDLPTREMFLLGGEMVIRVFAGIEHGWIEVEIRPAGSA